MQEDAGRRGVFLSRNFLLRKMRHQAHSVSGSRKEKFGFLRGALKISCTICFLVIRRSRRSADERALLTNAIFADSV